MVAGRAGRPPDRALPGVVGPAARRGAGRGDRARRRGGGPARAGRARGDRGRRLRAVPAVQPGGQHRHDPVPCRGSPRRCAAATVVGVSPIIGGAPVRGMADACLAAIGVATTAAAVAAHYGPGLLDGWLVDDQDKAAADDAGAGRDRGPGPAAADDRPGRGGGDRRGRGRAGPGAVPVTGSGSAGFSVTGVRGLPEIAAGDDLAALIARRGTRAWRDGDIVVVTSKIVSKVRGPGGPGRPGRGDRGRDGPRGGPAGPDHDRADPARPGAGRGRGGRVQHRAGHRRAAAGGPGRLGPAAARRAAAAVRRAGRRW